MTHLLGEVRRRDGSPSLVMGCGSSLPFAGELAAGRISRPTLSHTVVALAPVAPCSTCAMRGRTSSVEYVSAIRSENEVITSYGVARFP